MQANLEGGRNGRIGVITGRITNVHRWRNPPATGLVIRPIRARGAGRSVAGMDTHTHTSDLQELAQRSSNGLAVRLLWARSTNTVSVRVHDEVLDEEFELVVEPGTSPLAVFTHPFAYAAWRGVDYGELDLAA